MLATKQLVIFMGFLLMVGCRLQITVPEEGRVVTASGEYNCRAGQTCTVTVSDTSFRETFTAGAAEGYLFAGWERNTRSLCGGSLNPCELFTSGFASFDLLMAILKSDETYYLTPTFIKADAIRRYQPGDIVKFSGTAWREQAIPPGVLSIVSIRMEFLDPDLTYLNKHVLKLRTTAAVTTGKEVEEMITETHFWQEDDGALYQLTDAYGNSYLDAVSNEYGLASIPSPLLPFTRTEQLFYTLFGGHTSGPITSGSRLTTVAQRETLDTPMGSYPVYPVGNMDRYEYLMSYADYKRDSAFVIDNILWVSQAKGIVKAKSVQREYSNTGALQQTLTLEYSAIWSNF